MTDQKTQINKIPLFQLGFRPFFLLAAIASIVLIGYWLLLWPGIITAHAYYPPHLWHPHEMLFGYTVAVISGFILTAVTNWTGMDTARGGLLLALCLLWLCGRILALLPFIPDGLIALIDMAFLPMLAISLIKPLWQSENKVNRVFILILFSMALANGLMHAETLGYTNTASLGITLMLDLVILLILMVSGRVLPFFTNMGVPGTTAVQRPWVERSSVLLMIALTIMHPFIDGGWPIALLAFALCIVQLVRVSGWYNHGIWNKPVLWVLFTGYGWIVAGFALTGLAALNLFPANLATHALTIGVIGVFTLGMMARVSLGHTGRAMQTAAPINIAFVLMNLATFIRVFAPVLLPLNTDLWIQLSGGLWLAAFILFTIIYTPILMQPRIDSKPG